MEEVLGLSLTRFELWSFGKDFYARYPIAGA